MGRVMGHGCPLCGSGLSTPVLVADGERLVRCRHCRLLYQDPRPVEAVRQHYDNLYDNDSGSDHLDERRRALFRGFLDRWPTQGFGRLLDVGCGSGEFLLQARERGWSVAGVEVSTRGVAVAQRRGLSVHPDVAALPGDHFDAVTLWNVVDFFSHPVEQLRQIHRVLAPGGLVFVRTPNAAYQMAAWRVSRVLVWPPPVARLLTEAYFFQPIVWAPRTLRQLLLCAGLTDIRLWNSDVSQGDPYRPGSAGRERVVVTVKHAVRLLARMVYGLTRGRLLVGSSISALARKPG
jgi:2-polyprenyl-3-methyl-5-hydroxy-6-metoxy-1,4-benzoquinol methylase